jgi:hypothetical protein
VQRGASQHTKVSIDLTAAVKCLQSLITALQAEFEQQDFHMLLLVTLSSYVVINLSGMCPVILKAATQTSVCSSGSGV